MLDSLDARRAKNSQPQACTSDGRSPSTAPTLPTTSYCMHSVTDSGGPHAKAHGPLPAHNLILYGLEQSMVFTF